MKGKLGDIVHFNVRSIYSIGESTNTIRGLVLRARKLKMKALALADTGVLSGACEFRAECLSRDSAVYGDLLPIKPILGLTAPVSFRGGIHKAMLFAKNAAGFANLVRISSECAMSAPPFARAIPPKTVAKWHEGLVCLVGGDCAAFVNYLLKVFGDDLVLAANDDTYDFSAWPSVPVCATPPIIFASEDGAEAREVLWDCMEWGDGSEDLRQRLPGGYQLLSSIETAALFPNHLEWVSATSALAGRFEVFALDKPERPPAPRLPRRFASPSDYLKHLVFAGAKRRWGRELPPDAAIRLERELGAIATADRARGAEDVASYFLIVREYVTAARRMGIPATADRSATPGSAVAYALGLTTIDPLAHGLLFERFFHPGDKFPVTIDVDFAETTIDGEFFFGAMLAHLRRQYGKDHVATVSYYKQPPRDEALWHAARRAGVSPGTAEKLYSSIPPWAHKTLRKSIVEIKGLNDILLHDNGPRGRMLRLAAECGDCHSQMASSICKVALSRGKLPDGQPIAQYLAPGFPQTQFSGPYVEKTGTLVVNLLGLPALAQQARCAELVLKAHGIKIDIGEIPHDDKAAFEVFAKGDTKGVFLFDSIGMQEWLVKLKPSSLPELAALFALFRPGVGQLLKRYVDRKTGLDKVANLHPIADDILAETFGLIIWQEQMMAMAQALAGFSPEESDLLRLAVGRHDDAAVAETRQMFVMGCLANPEFMFGLGAKGISPRKAAEGIWSEIMEMSAFAFNKSHAYGLSLLAYRLAYLKAHWPAEFAAAAMTQKET